MKKRLILIAVILMLLVPLVHAKQGHMKLLAVTEGLDENTGSIADLTLEIRPGSGKVFVDTFPLTKFDTQISMRFAKQIACNFLDVDCSNYDFSYTIEAKTGIIGGHSAGAAAATLTVMMLKDFEYDENIAITGTINSGGVIGPVGGLKEKISAAGRDNISKVLIAAGQGTIIEKDEKKKENTTIDLIRFGKENGVEVIEVESITHAVNHFSGESILHDEDNLSIDESYKDVMRSLAEQLCGRNQELKEFFYKEVAGKISDEMMLKKAETAINMTRDGEQAFDEGMYYSAASYCFRSNVDLSHLVFFSQYPSTRDVEKKLEALDADIKEFEEDIEDQKLNTITDLQTYMIVKERLMEAKDYMNSTIETLEENQKDALFFLAFGYERLNSAKSWATFFGTEGKEFALEPERIRESCKNKIAEAEERYQYVKVYMLRPFESIDKELKRAYEDLANEDYELCLFKASKAKAEIDSVVSVFGVAEKDIDTFFEQKLEVAERTLARAQRKGIFPIIGYSYYEYAQSIKEDNVAAALLFLEYSLEIGNLDVYFEPKKPIYMEMDFRWIGYILIGVAIGIMITIPFKLRKEKKKRPSKKTLKNALKKALKRKKKTKSKKNKGKRSKSKRK